jgi:MFS family permease
MQRGTHLRRATAFAGSLTAVHPHPYFSGWRMLGVSSAGMLLAQIAQSSGIAVFVDPMIGEFGWSRSVISLAYTVSTLISAAVVLFAGRMLDRRGHRQVMLWATIVFAISLVAMGAINGVVALMVFMIVMRVSGGSILPLASRTLVALWFSRRRGRAISIVNVGKMFGVALLPLGDALLVESIGWRAAWRVNAIIVVVVMIPLALWFVHSRPEHIGQFPDGIRPEPQPQPLRAADGPRRNLHELSWTLRQASHNRAFWLLLSSSFVPALVTNGIAFNQISILSHRGLTSTQAAMTFTVESVIALPVTILAGWVADRYGPRYVLIAGNSLLLVSTLWLGMPSTLTMALIYAAMRAVTSGTWVLGIEAAFPLYFGRAHLGSLASVNFCVTFIGAAIGPLPLAFAYDRFGHYDMAIWSLAILPAVATVTSFLAWPPRSEPTVG